MRVAVCPLSAVEVTIAAHGARHLISLMSEPDMIPMPSAIMPHRHLKLHVNDIDTEMDGLVAPAIEHARDLIDFARRWDRAEPVVIHCFAGISRSTAAALTVLSAMAEDGTEAEIARAMRQASPSASPNRLLIAHADAALGRGGRLVAAVEAMGPATLAMEGRPFTLDLPAARRVA